MNAKKKALKTLINVYIKPIRSKPDLLTEEESQLIFSNIEEIYSFHFDFLERMKSVLSREQTDGVGTLSIGACFLKMVI